MGFRLSWIAVRGRSSDEVLTSLSLKRTGQWQEIPESAISCANLPDNWFLIVTNDYLPTITGPESANALSAGCECVICHVNETTMDSMAGSYADGACLWEVSHSAERGGDDIVSHGTAPSALSQILERSKAAHESAGGVKADVDHFFDVPIELARSIVGYRHDEDIESENADVFEVLEQRKRRWRFW